LLRTQIAILNRFDLTLGLTQVEEQLFLRGGCADLYEAPAAQNVFLDRGADPPHRIGRQPEPFVRLELLDRLHQADIAFRDHLGDRQTIAAIAHGDLGHQPQMRRHKLMRSVAVFMLPPALGEHIFLRRLQHRELTDFRKVAAEAAFGR
jgi:hypothetical protein